MTLCVSWTARWPSDESNGGDGSGDSRTQWMTRRLFDQVTKRPK